MTGYRVIESNEALGTMRYRGESTRDLALALETARIVFGDYPSRRRRFYVVLLETPGGRVEYRRGTA
jgi:hypothetical protein